jgi:hypothetical protein
MQSGLYAMQVYSNVLDMVGKTPMLEIRRIDTGLCQLFLKLELANPGGSVKDRIGISMIEEAERRGDICRAKGLPTDPRVARQDESGKDFQPAGDGR